MRERLIEFQKVSFSYLVRRGWFSTEKKNVVNCFSFHIHEGETFGVIGKNGVGKSTLLRLIADLLEPDRGTIIRNPKLLRSSLLSIDVGFEDELKGRENAILSGMIQLNKSRSVVKNQYLSNSG